MPFHEFINKFLGELVYFLKTSFIKGLLFSAAAVALLPLLYSVSYSAPSINSVVIDDADTIYQDGDAIQLRVVADTGTPTVLVNLNALDSMKTDTVPVTPGGQACPTFPKRR